MSKIIGLDWLPGANFRDIDDLKCLSPKTKLITECISLGIGLFCCFYAGYSTYAENF